MGLKNEFEPAVVNEPSVFEPLKFDCINCIMVVTGHVAPLAGNLFFGLCCHRENSRILLKLVVFLWFNFLMFGIPVLKIILSYVYKCGTSGPIFHSSILLLS